jgi:CHAD domain-containing protein
VEIEAKYAILGPLNATALASLDLGPFALFPEEVNHHRDVLLDTPTRAITSSGVAVRLRYMDDGSVLVTFKGPNAGSNGIHEREEIEREIENPNRYDYTHWPAEIVSRIQPLVHDEPLVPLVRIYIHRRTWAVERGGRVVAEMALDQGIINAGGRTARVHELEVELKHDGTRTDLDDLGRRLLEQLPLQPQPRGKLQRGLALLDKRRTLDGHASLEAVGRHMVRRHLRKLRQHEPALRAEGDAESVHDMRVATRRLRTALRILEEAPVFSPRPLKKMRRDLHALALSLGEVRDLDVFLERVEQYADEQPDLRPDFDVLLQRLRSRRVRAFRRLMERLARGKYGKMLGALERFTEAHDGLRPGAMLLVRHFAGSAIWRRYEALLSYETVLPEAQPETLHQVRIACKRLRYVLELFEGELGKGARPLISQLVKLQDHLGALQDCVVACRIVQTLRAEHQNNHGLSIYAAALGAEIERLRRSFPPLWTELSDPSFCEELAEVIAGL